MFNNHQKVKTLLHSTYEFVIVFKGIYLLVTYYNGFFIHLIINAFINGMFLKGNDKF